eukprot:c16654_g1_i2 orf=841-1407(-)
MLLRFIERSPVTSLLGGLGFGPPISRFNELIHAPFQNREHDSRCVERGVLVEELAKPLPPGTIRYNSQIVAIHKAKNDVSPITVELLDGTTISTKVLIGCDGVHSVVAKWLGLPNAKTSGVSAIRGLTEYPEGHKFESGLLQTLGGGVRAGVLPLTASKVYRFLDYETSQGKFLNPTLHLWLYYLQSQ